PRADLYSCGIVMYEMLTALTPFAGGSHAEVYTKQLSYAPKPPRDARPDVPISVEFEQIVLKALEKNREDRFPSAVAMKTALEAALAKQSGGGRVRAKVAPDGSGPLDVAPSARPQERFPLTPAPRREWAR